MPESHVSGTGAGRRAYGLVGRLMFVSAAVLFLLAVLFLTGVAPVSGGAGRLVALLLGFTAVVDAGLGFFFLSRDDR